MKNIEQTIGDYRGNKVKEYYQIVKGGSGKRTSGVDINVFKYLEKILPKNLKDKIALDIGCGDGRWSEYLCRLGAKKVIGIDISQDMIVLAKQRKIKNKLVSLRLVQADIQKILLREKSVDMVLSTFSLMYFKNLESVITEICRVLKDEGQLYIATNIIVVKDLNLLKKLIGQCIPINLGFGDKKIRLENIVQPLEQYKKAFKKSNLAVEDEKYFPPTKEVSIAPDYRHKDKIVLEKAVFKLRKVEKRASRTFLGFEITPAHSCARGS